MQVCSRNVPAIFDRELAGGGVGSEQMKLMDSLAVAGFSRLGRVTGWCWTVCRVSLTNVVIRLWTSLLAADDTLLSGRCSRQHANSHARTCTHTHTQARAHTHALHSCTQTRTPLMHTHALHSCTHTRTSFMHTHTHFIHAHTRTSFMHTHAHVHMHRY